jgi:hypothetical protein
MFGPRAQDVFLAVWKKGDAWEARCTYQEVVHTFRPKEDSLQLLFEQLRKAWIDSSRSPDKTRDAPRMTLAMHDSSGILREDSDSCCFELYEAVITGFLHHHGILRM